MNAESEEFYRRLAPIYDRLFPVEADTIGLLTASGAGVEHRVLDLACGSGLYTQALLDIGVDCYGLDGSPDLIEMARARSSHPEKFMVADMLDLGAPGSGHAILPEAFDLVFCIGNSLSHLESGRQVREVLGSMAGQVRPRAGRIVIQDVDMETIPVGGVRELPSLATDDVTFERCYRREAADRVVFDASLTDRHTGTRLSLKNELRVLGGSDLVEWLSALGFRTVNVWGGFRRQPAEGSWVRVMLAEDLEGA